MRPLQVLSVASEIFPLVKTGGLADVAGALPEALAREDVRVRTLVPGYPAVTGALEEAEIVHSFGDLLGVPARLLAGRAGGLPVFALDAPDLYDRPGNPYQAPGGGDWPDNDRRFAALALVAAALGRGIVPAFVPDIVHAHDWQAGLAPAYLRLGPAGPPSVMTVHNLAFQGTFPAERLADLRLPPEAFGIDGLEYNGGIGFLKAGIFYADRITTVSPTYAVEIQTDEGGMGLGGLLRTRAADLTGILNGIDEEIWNPAADPHLVARFDVERLARREQNKRALQERMGLAPDDRLVFGVVSRLSWQKGLDLLLETLSDVLAHGAQIALLGAGEGHLEEAFRHAAATHPGNVGVVIGHDESLAHLIQGGADALLVPSRFEPCGLTQLCALRYGAVPVVARVGGLADTVIDANAMALAAGVATGIQFAPVTAAGLAAAVARAASLWRARGAWRRLQTNGMRSDVGWRMPARRYAELYRDLARAPVE